MLGIDAQAHVHLDGLVELGELDFLDKGNGLFEGDTACARPVLTQQNTSYLICGSCVNGPNGPRRDIA